MTKISEQNLLEINTLRDKLSTVVSEAGQLALQIRLLEDDLAKLKSSFSEKTTAFQSLLEEEQQLINRLSTEYGAGSVNFDTGEFTPEK